jgi:hypothetical protein
MNGVSSKAAAKYLRINILILSVKVLKELRRIQSEHLACSLKKYD